MQKMRQMAEMATTQAKTVHELRSEKDQLSALLEQSHEEHFKVHKELKRASKYIS